MAKKKKIKGIPTKARCDNCKFNMPYPKQIVGDKPHFYCGRLVEPLTFWQHSYNIFYLKYYGGSGSPLELKKTIREWMTNDTEFNWFGVPIGKIVKGCPGFVKKETT